MILATGEQSTYGVEYKYNSTSWDITRLVWGLYYSGGSLFPFLILTWFPSPSSFLLLHYILFLPQTPLNPPSNRTITDGVQTLYFTTSLPTTARLTHSTNNHQPTTTSHYTRPSAIIIAACRYYYHSYYRCRLFAPFRLVPVTTRPGQSSDRHFEGASPRGCFGSSGSCLTPIPAPPKTLTTLPPLDRKSVV